jgi:PKD repeat protein
VTASINVTATVASLTTERRVSASSDDAEESSSAVTSLSSSDLELVYDTSNQTVGMRWLNLPIPPGSTITAAYVQFSAKEAQSEVTNLSIQGQAADNPPTFASTTGNVSSRPRTSASVTWSPVAWNIGEVGANQRTPDLTSVIQQIVSRPGWASGNAMALIVTGTGHRTAWAWDGNAASAPLLHVEYVAPELPPVAKLTVSQALSPPLTVNADASGSTYVDATPIASYQFDFGDGSPIVTTTVPTATASHTYAAAGTYTVTLTAIDTGNSASAPATASINVSASSGALYSVYAGYYDTHHATNPKPKPDPWRGSPSTVFVGTQDNQSGDPPSGAWDTSCLRIDNLTTGTLTVSVTVDIGTHHYALWGTPSIPVGNHLVLAQTAFENFDGSDLNAAGCYGCDPAQCTPLYNSTIPVVHVTVNGTTTNFTDSGQILNTHGVDAAGCPYVGGPLPQTRYDESTAWQQIYPPGQAPPTRSEPTSPAALLSSLPERKLWLSAPLPNPSHGDVFVRFTTPLSGPVRLDLYDLSGRLVRPCISNVLEAAGYGFQLDLSDVHPGIYFLHLATPMGARNEKLVLMR